MDGEGLCAAGGGSGEIGVRQLLEIANKPAVRHRDYTFLGTTQSLCPECLAVVPAKIIAQAFNTPIVILRSRRFSAGPKDLNKTHSQNQCEG